MIAAATRELATPNLGELELADFSVGDDSTARDTLKLVGFFGSGVVINYFDEPVAPFGVRTLVTPILQ